MKQIASRTLTVLASLCFAVALPVTDALAQQKQKVTYKVSAANAKYPVRHTLEIGDEPGHQVGIFEIHRTFPGDAPVFNGVKLKETWSRGYSDYVNSNGASINYTVFVLENGDKFFTRSTTMGQADAAGKRSTISVGHVTGGTGKFVSMKGLVRSQGASDGKAGFNETQSEIEYWFAK